MRYLCGVWQWMGWDVIFSADLCNWIPRSTPTKIKLFFFALWSPNRSLARLPALIVSFLIIISSFSFSTPLPLLFSPCLFFLSINSLSHFIHPFDFNLYCNSFFQFDWLNSFDPHSPKLVGCVIRSWCFQKQLSDPRMKGRRLNDWNKIELGKRYYTPPPQMMMLIC